MAVAQGTGLLLWLALACAAKKAPVPAPPPLTTPPPPKPPPPPPDTGPDGIWPHGHWARVKWLTKRNVNFFVRENVDAGKTAFIRWIATETCEGCVKSSKAWNKIVEDFHTNPYVEFGDIVLMKNMVDSVHGEMQYPGKDGWPTIRYFNQITGLHGKGYENRTTMQLHDELGLEQGYLRSYIEEAGMTSGCNIDAVEESCRPEERTFIEKWAKKRKADGKEQIWRLRRMSTKEKAFQMKPNALRWVRARMLILEQLDDKKEL